MRGIGAPSSTAGVRARRWDAIILGGALPGLIAAARLGMDGQRVLVVEEEAAARRHPALREPFHLAGAGSGGILDACLRTLTVPLIDRKKIEADPIAYQLVFPHARIDVGEPQTTAEELVCWGFAKPEEARELVRALLEAAAAERAAMLEASVVRAGGLRALARGASTPRPARHGRGLPLEVAAPSPALVPVLDAQVRALSQLAEATPPPEARARLLGSALEGGSAFLPAAEGELRGLLRRRVQALFGEFRQISGRFQLVAMGNAPGIAVEGSHDVWLGRVLIVNAPRSALAAALTDSSGGAPSFLDGPPAARRRACILLRGRRSVLPEGMARRIVCVGDLGQPTDGTNVVTLCVHPSPQGSDIVDLVGSAIVPPAYTSAAEDQIETALRALMPFSEGVLRREPIRAVQWDEDWPGDPALGEGWPGDTEIRVSSRPPIYVLPRESVASLGFEGDVLLGWRAGDAIRADVA
ncbi:MAG TPA: hypothetical protein VKM54_24990 [Myxococcota bacterium]|nr:hypothetical protein [Myxococcota bacterium]